MFASNRLAAVFCSFVLLQVTGAPTSYSQTFIDDTFEDFSRGTLDAGGQNLYVSKDGKVRTIHRFDLNDDGYVDLLFNCTHNTYQMLPATACIVGKDRQAKSLDIAVEGSLRVAVGDLNRDGYADLVFCPNGIGVDQPRRFVQIAWGGPDGWPAKRVNGTLPINSPTAVAIVDLNGDGWPDIAVLGAARWQIDQPEGNCLRIFWGSESGFLADDRLDLGVASALDLASGDFDGDGARDLAVLRGDGKVTVIWAAKGREAFGKGKRTEVALPGAHATCLIAADLDGDDRLDLVAGTRRNEVYVVAGLGGRAWRPARGIPAFPASHIAVGDLDGDGKPDLVLTQSSFARAAGGEQAGVGKDAEDKVRIVWGGEHFALAKATQLPAKFAVATAIGDLDGDGKADLIVAVHQADDRFNGESLVFYGQGQHRFTRGAAGFRTAGTTDVAFVPAEKKLPPRAVFCNSIGGLHDEGVPLHVYWGGPNGFDPKRLWKIPFHSGYEASAADLNADGYVDLIALDSGHAGEISLTDPTLGANIFWGGPKGFDLEKRRTVLKEMFLGTSSVADLNRDGYLDLVLEPFGPQKPGEKDILIIYYGGPDGFNKSRRVTLPKEGYSQEHVVADFNRDGWLDIAVTSRTLHAVRIFWGGPQGFDAKRESRIKISSPIGLKAADLNGDGHLDLVVSSYGDAMSRHRDFGSVIFWGSPDGYSPTNSQWLPGFSPLGRTIADFDGDGYLDIFSPQHSGELTREDQTCHIYWGSATGFATRRRTTLICDSVCDSMAGDFNGDGKIDIAVACHTKHGDHRTFSKVFYNDGQRFENPRVQKLPTNGVHLMWALDMGHIYHRRHEQLFDSRVFTWSEPAKDGKLTYKAEVPAKAALAFQIRSAKTAAELKAKAWKAVANGGFAVAEDDRCLQYRAVFQSQNGDRYPILDRVEVKVGR